MYQKSEKWQKLKIRLSIDMEWENSQNQKIFKKKEIKNRLFTYFKKM